MADLRDIPIGPEFDQLPEPRQQADAVDALVRDLAIANARAAVALGLLDGCAQWQLGALMGRLLTERDAG